jgi:hypothetical protein
MDTLQLPAFPPELLKDVTGERCDAGEARGIVALILTHQITT